MSEPLLCAKGLCRTYSGTAGSVEVLRDLDLDVLVGEAVAIVGDSGVGKSTLLHVLGGLDRPDGGRLLFRGDDLFSGISGGLERYRNRHVGFVFQAHHLLPEFTALENVEMPFRIGRSREPFTARCRAILERLGLGDRTHHRPGELSGGEQQRVAMARALVAGPDLVLADEPTGNLDPATGKKVFALLRELQSERSFSLVLASHSGRLASGCDRVLRLIDGSLEPMGEAETRNYFDGLGD